MLIAAVVFALGVVMLLAERVVPGRHWPQVRGWWTRAIALNLVQVASVYLAGVAYDGWLLRHRPWSADALGAWGGGVIGYLAITFVYYFWHRARHEVDFLWRWFHQVHHSPQRIEIITSFYKHPIEIAANGVLSSVIVYLGVGLGAEAAAAAVGLSGVAELFYHWNVRTPYWVGFLIQRPESHCVHHQEGLHRYNFADLPLWDMLGGTFRNPRDWRESCGFGDEAEHRLGDMLRGRDLTRELAGRGRG